ncbi:hypothetical protein [uncultured Microbulbifer sp.]|uniref:hypothetical protein n=1 Tax=uncultured Microbulbifer sp. TaxID=348147 RepID=UPI002632A7A0|nr:hypothetical protein [uncultured Microbulbifer sp.]
MVRLVQQHEFKITKENKDAITALAQDENSIVTARKIEGKDLHVNVVSKSAVASTVDRFKEFIRADFDSLTEQYAKQREEREKEDEKWLSTEDIENLFSAPN